MSEKHMGLREKVRKGIVSLDEAIEIAKDYNEDIRKWLSRRKQSGVKADSGVKPQKRKRKAKKNAEV